MAVRRGRREVRSTSSILKEEVEAVVMEEEVAVTEVADLEVADLEVADMEVGPI